MSDKLHLNWATGPLGGSWHKIVRGLAGLLKEQGLQVEVVAAGGKENPRLVERGECDFATTVDFVAAAARHGLPPYNHPHRRLRCIGGGWSPLPFHFVGPAGAGGSLLDALARPGARFGIPPASTFDELTFRRVLAYAGTSYEGLRARGGDVLHADYQALPCAFIEGRVDWFFGATSAPGQPVLQLAQRPGGAALLPIDAELVEHLRSGYGYSAGSVRRADYPGLTDADLPAPVMDTVFLVRSDVPDALVEQVTRVLLQQRARLPAIHASLAAYDPARSVLAAPVPLHPGARSAYAAAGIRWE